MAYLQACTLLEDESPYTNIVALDEKAAILHYQHKRRIPADGSKVLLIDAGYRVNGYGSDITRTSVKPSVHKAFKALLTGIERIEQQLVAMVKPGVNYPDIHLACDRGSETYSHKCFCSLEIMIKRESTSTVLFNDQFRFFCKPFGQDSRKSKRETMEDQ